MDEILSFFGGRAEPMMAQLANAGKLTPDDVRELEKTIRKLKAQQKKAEGICKAAIQPTPISGALEPQIPPATQIERYR